jgi:CheY-like chemotaxis protein
MVYGAIRSHNGVIEVDSEIGKGTLIKIYLPIIKRVKDDQLTVESTPAKANGELILVADDNSVLRMITEEALFDMGYRVITAVDGVDALNNYEKHMNEIVLVILDVVMPKMNGVDTARKLRLLKNNLPIIFTTGYDKVEALKNQQDIENSIILSKPFPPEKLNHSIAKLLETM